MHYFPVLFVFWKRTLHVSTDLLSIIRSLNTVFTAICICHTIYTDFLRADNQYKQYDKYWCEYGIKAPDDRQ
jgi:hypothetical protein